MIVVCSVLRSNLAFCSKGDRVQSLVWILSSCLPWTVVLYGCWSWLELWPAKEILPARISWHWHVCSCGSVFQSTSKQRSWWFQSGTRTPRKLRWWHFFYAGSELRPETECWHEQNYGIIPLVENQGYAMIRISNILAGLIMNTDNIFTWVNITAIVLSCLLMWLNIMV